MKEYRYNTSRSFTRDDTGPWKAAVAVAVAWVYFGVHYEQATRPSPGGGGSGNGVSVHWYIMSRQSGTSPTELGDLLGKELDAVDGVAEDYGLVDLQLGEQRVQAVHLTPGLQPHIYTEEVS